MYFKESLPIKERCDLETLPETIVAEIRLDRKKGFIVLSYRHPIMSNDESIQYMSPYGKKILLRPQVKKKTQMKNK